jgi:hypothetical protein
MLTGIVVGLSISVATDIVALFLLRKNPRLRSMFVSKVGGAL